MRGNRSGEGSENPPPKHANGKHAARAKLVRKPSARSLKQSVTRQKCAENPSEPNLREMVIACQQTPGNRNVDAVQIGDCAEHKKPKDQQPTDLACLCGTQSRSFSPRSSRPERVTRP